MAQARFIRIDDDTWKKAQQRAAQENTTVSELARAWIEYYAQGRDEAYESSSISAELGRISAELDDLQKRVAGIVML
jgi:hypothetical protein